MKSYVPGCSVLLLLLTGLVVQAQDRVLFKFDDSQAAKSWRTVNDGVMGGRSDGRLKVNSNKFMEFYGNLSLENNGGFASVRARADKLNLKTGESIALRVRGDGRKYNFNVYTQSNLGGYSYRQSFTTKKGEWVEVRMPLDQFVATWRGRTFPKERLDPAKVAGMGILLGDKRPGPFKLEVDWIKATNTVTK